MKIAQIVSNPVVAMIAGLDDTTKLMLSDAMAYTVEGHEHMGASGWDGRSTLYDWASGKFPAGYIPSAIAVLTQQGYQVQQRRAPLPEPLGPVVANGAAIIDAFPHDPNREYQFETVRVLEKHGNMIARVATGGGKSRIAALCITRIGRKTAFVTTRQVLLYQMGKALDEVSQKLLEAMSDRELLERMGQQMASRLKGFSISYIGDGEWDTSGDVVLAMVQTLADRLAPFKADPRTYPAGSQELAAHTARWQKRYDDVIAFCDSVEFLIAEEAHEAGGNSYYEVCKAMRKAHYRLALTATPMMRDGESNVRLVGMFGPVRIKVTEKQLIDAGILARPFFKFIEINRLKQPPTLKASTSWQKAEEHGIMLNHWRNKHVCAEVIRASRWGLSSMVLVKRQKHGKVLHEMLQQAGLRGTYIFGESNKKKRDEALTKLGKGEYDYVIGSTILDVGVDVPSIGLLVIASGGKAEVAHRQRIGRGLRAKRTMPNVAFVVDFRDMTNRHLIKHSAARRKIVEDTPGFAEGILRTGQDFDLEGLGFTRPTFGIAA